MRVSQKTEWRENARISSHFFCEASSDDITLDTKASTRLPSPCLSVPLSLVSPLPKPTPWPNLACFRAKETRPCKSFSKYLKSTACKSKSDGWCSHKNECFRPVHLTNHSFLQLLSRNAVAIQEGNCECSKDDGRVCRT